MRVRKVTKILLAGLMTINLLGCSSTNTQKSCSTPEHAQIPKEYQGRYLTEEYKAIDAKVYVYINKFITS